MKIILVANTSYSRTAGLARCVILLSESLQKQGHSVRILFSLDVGGCRGGAGLSLLTFPFFVIKPILDTIRSKGGCDVVHIHTLSAWVYVVLRKLFKWLPPCVIFSCGDDTMRWLQEKEEERLGYRRLTWRARLLYYNFVIRPGRFALRHADHIITPVTAEKEFYRDSLGIRQDRISVVIYGVADSFFNSRKFRDRPDKLLYLGGWEWRKGIRYLISAFELINESFPYVTLTLAGVGQHRLPIIGQFAQRLQERVIILPFIPEQEIPELYRNHDIFVFPSFFESLALVVLEAMASAMPVVTTNVCGMPDVLKDGVSGYLVPARDARTLADRVMQLLSNRDLCQRLGTAAQQRARELSWDNSVAKTVAVYEQVIASKKGVRC